jgi:uncharacterized protein YjbI with pentapeptide repeats
MRTESRSSWRSPVLWPPSAWQFTSLQQKIGEFLFSILLLVFFCIFTFSLFSLLAIIYHATTALAAGQHESARNYLLSLGAILGVPFLIWRTLIAANQAETGRESLYTQLFTSGVERLASEKVTKIIEKSPKFLTKGGDLALSQQGKPIQLQDEDGKSIYEIKTIERTEINIEVRLGAVYALERVALDSKRDKNSIMKTIAAYIRNNIPLDKIESSYNINNRPDIKAAIEVLGRFPVKSKANVTYDLTGINLKNLQIRECKLESCDFTKSASDEFIIIESSLDESIFHEISWPKFKAFRSSLNHANFYKAEMNDSMYFNCIINSISISDSNFRGFQSAGSKFNSAKIHKVNLSNSSFRSSDIVDCEFNDTDISESRISSGSITRCIFEKCDLSFSDLSQCNIEESEFIECNLTGTRFPEGIIINIDNNFTVSDEWFEQQMKTQPIYEIIKFRAANEWHDWLSTRRGKDALD